MYILRFSRFTMVLLVMLMLSACINSRVVYAPVSDATIIDPIPKNGLHQVKKGESVYSIAWRYGIDSRSLAVRNHLTRPYHVYIGQTIYLKGRLPVSIVSPPVKVIPILPKRLEPTAAVLVWHWPAKGPVIAGFSTLNKGINIGGHYGDPIYATAAGKVVYSGNGLRGYGNLIIVEHNRFFLTAYAHNSVVLVKEGQSVRAGQKIAKMGDSGARRIMLHFEIRKVGKPVNPLTYLRG